jgi:hypothetical protein
LLVLVEQPAEQIASTHFAKLIRTDDGQPGGPIGCFEPKRSVWTVTVAVREVDLQDMLQVTESDDQEPVQALSADCPYPPLRICVRPWCPHWREEHLGTL